MNASIIIPIPAMYLIKMIRYRQVNRQERVNLKRINRPRRWRRDPGHIIAFVFFHLQSDRLRHALRESHAA